jgi:hypothetical protein
MRQFMLVENTCRRLTHVAKPLTLVRISGESDCRMCCGTLIWAGRFVLGG